jgi:hypothetical protein
MKTKMTQLHVDYKKPIPWTFFALNDLDSFEKYWSDIFQNVTQFGFV